MSTPVLTVVIPAFNEAERLESTLHRVGSYLHQRALKSEIVVIDDGSEDLTAKVAEVAATRSANQWTLQLLRNQVNRGKGYSVRRGMLAAQGRYALLTDADLSTPIEEFAKLEEKVVTGPFDVAIGSRDVDGSQVEVRQSWLRERGGKLFNLLVRGLLGLSFRDTQCGFKLFDMKRCREIFRRQTVDGFAFDVEVLSLGLKMGLTIAEVPVVWSHSPGSKVHFIRDGVDMISTILRVRWRLSGRRREAGGR